MHRSYNGYLINMNNMKINDGFEIFNEFIY
jgi:hypothetical protein